MRQPAANGTSRAAPSPGKRQAPAWNTSPCSRTIGSTGGTIIPRQRFGATRKADSLRSERVRGLNAADAQGRKKTSRASRKRQDEGNRDEGHQVMGADTINLAGKNTHRQKCKHNARDQTTRGSHHS